jgi:hypothetical protein
VDDVHLYLSPVAIGAGKPALQPSTATRLTLVDTNRFPGGTLHVHYEVVK